MPHEAQRIKKRFMAVWQIPTMDKMTFSMADIVNRRILDGPFDEKETRLLSRQLGLSVSELNPFLDMFVSNLQREIQADSIQQDTIMYRGESRPPKYAHSLTVGSIHRVQSFSSFSALPSTALGFTRSSDGSAHRQSTLFRVLMHRGAQCAYLKNAMTVRDPKACDVIFDEFEYLAGPGMQYKVIDVSSVYLGYKEVLVVSMIQFTSLERTQTGDMGTIAYMDADLSWQRFRYALETQVIQEQQMWNTLRDVQVENRIWDMLATATIQFQTQGYPFGKSSHVLGNSQSYLLQLALSVQRLENAKAKVVGKKIGWNKAQWKECLEQNWPVPTMIHDVVKTVAMARPIALSQPVTLYVQMPVWWYRWDKPNPVYDSLSQRGRFSVNVPLIAQFNPHRQLWTSYMNMGQEPPLLACHGTRPVRENQRTVFCLTFSSVRGVLPRNLHDPFQMQIVLFPPFECLYVASERIKNGANQTIEMRHIRIL